MAEADIGLFGLAVMGSSLALNIAGKGFCVAVHNRSPGPVASFRARAEAEGLGERVIASEDMAAFVASIRRPRAIILLVKAGAAVDETIARLAPLLEPGDAILECGNSLRADTERRAAALAPSGVGYLGIGVSGGEAGARHGPAIMAGGPDAEWARVAPILTAIAARFEDEPCCALLGPGGAGHFVKTVHNGIEYADMQMIAEVYGVMRDGLGLSAAAMADAFAAWNAGPLNSYLIEITADVLRTGDAETGRPLVDLILDRAGQKGTGTWSAVAGQELGVPATAIEGAVAARSLSARRPERLMAATAYGPLGGGPVQLSLQTIGGALMAGKLVAYAQGFDLLAAASREAGWGLALARIARVWRAGCIIRSRLLDRMAAAFDTAGDGNLLLAPDFVALMGENHGALRALVAETARAGLPAMALSSALSYFDAYRQPRGTANLIQAQRDYFGAHGFEIEGRGAGLHGDWPA